MKKKITKIIASVLAVASMSVSVNAAIYNDVTYPWMDDVFRLDIGLNADKVTDGDDATEIEALLCMLGIMQRDAEGKFNASAKLTRAVFEAATRVIYSGEAVDFAEYETKYQGQVVKQEEIVARLLGFIETAGIDTNTIDVEQYGHTTGILEGITYSATREMTRGEFALAVWNTLNSSYVSVSYENGTFTLDSDEDKTLLQDKLNVYEIEGKVTAIPGLNLYGTISPDENIIEINRAKYNIGEFKNAVEYFGYDVEGYAKYDEDSETYTIMSIAPSKKDETIKVELLDIVSFEDGIIEYDEEETTKRARYSEFKYILYNGDLVSEITDEMLDDSGTLILAKSSRDSRYDIAIIREYENYFMNSYYADTKTVFLAYGATYKGSLSIDLDVDTPVYCYIDGKLSDMSLAGKNRALSIIQNTSGSYTEIRVSTDTVESKVSGRGDRGVIIEDRDLVVDKNYKKLTESTTSGAVEITTGVKGIFYVTEYGVIAGFTQDGGQEYALMKKAWFDEENEASMAKLFTQDNVWVMAEFAETVEVDGSKLDNCDVSDALKTAKELDTDYDVMVVRIKRNADGKIKFVDTTFDSVDEKEEDDPDRLVEIVDFNGDVPWVGGWYVHGTPYHVPDNTPMFMIPDNSEKEAEYVYGTAAAIPRDNEKAMHAEYKAYTANSWNCASIVVRNGNSVPASNRDSYWYVYVRSVKEVYDEAEETVEEVLDCYQLTRGATDVTETQYRLPEGWETTFGITKEKLTGALVGITLNKDLVTGLNTKSFPYVSNNKVIDESGAATLAKDGRFWYANTTGNLNYGAGKVLEVDTANKWIKVDCGDGVVRTGMFAAYTVAGTDAKDSKHKARGITVEEINPGDMIYWYGSYYRLYVCLVIENYDWGV